MPRTVVMLKLTGTLAPTYIELVPTSPEQSTDILYVVLAATVIWYLAPSFVASWVIFNLPSYTWWSIGVL